MSKVEVSKIEMSKRRRAWLAQRRKLWEDFPTKPSQINNKSRIKYREIIQLMKADGLVSKNTYYLDVRLFSMLKELR
jgi:hypothetical protein